MPSDTDLIEVGLAIATSISIARTVAIEDAERYAGAAASERERTHTLGPILDPTAYRDAAVKADATGEVARAFLEFRRVIERNLAPDHLRAT